MEYLSEKATQSLIQERKEALSMASQRCVTLSRVEELRNLSFLGRMLGLLLTAPNVDDIRIGKTHIQMNLMLATI